MSQAAARGHLASLTVRVVAAFLIDLSRSVAIVRHFAGETARAPTIPSTTTICSTDSFRTAPRRSFCGMRPVRSSSFRPAKFP